MFHVSCLSPWARQNFPALIKKNKLCRIGKIILIYFPMHCVPLTETVLMWNNLREIRIVSIGKTHGYPDLVCKNSRIYDGVEA